MSGDNGYRMQPAGGPRVRTDVVDVYVFRAAGEEAGRGAAVIEGPPGEPPQTAAVEFLQLLRSGEPLAGTWQPVMGHIENGEGAVKAALRELDEELGLQTGGVGGLMAMWALEQVHPFYIMQIDSIVMSPRFAAQVTPGWTPRLNDEHSAVRWVPWQEVWRRFMWPGQVASCREIVEHLLRPGSLAREALRVELE